MSSLAILFVSGVTLLIIGTTIEIYRKKSLKKIETNQILLYLVSSLDNINKKLEDLPDTTVKKAVGRANVEKGALGELISYISLKSHYDKILPFNDTVDFIGIRFPTENDPGAVDFIDIKTGNARLTKDQIALKKIIREKNIEFIKFKVSVEDTEGFKE